MLKNNNSNAINLISRRSLKQNRIRNLFAVIAIILTAFMFTTVFSIGFSLAKNMDSFIKMQMGTTADMYLTHPTQKQIEQAKSCSALSHSGIFAGVQSASLLNNDDVSVTLIYSDNENFKYHIVPILSSVKGSYPVAENEIMMPVNCIKAMKIENPKLNMEIPLLVNGEERIFRLSGYFRDYGFRTNSYNAYISEAFADNAGITCEDGIFEMSAKKFSVSKLAGQLNESIQLSEDQEIKELNEALENNSVIAVIILFICIVIIISGYLLIYNIMYISVSRDIRFYGMLKTIGTTPQQIRKIVKKQAFRLSVIGIPVGTILGAFTSLIAAPLAVKFLNYESSVGMPVKLSFNPFIYGGTVLFAIITIALSCRKPAKIASRVSPVEALKYNGINSNKIKPKKTTNGGKLRKIAFRNVFREKKRAVLVFASMLMGSMSLLLMQSFIGSLKAENYVEYYHPDDYGIFPNYSSNDDYEVYDSEKIKAAEKLAEKIKNIDGVTDVMVNRSANINLLFDKNLYMPFLNDGKNETSEPIEHIISRYEEDPENSYKTQVVGVDRKMMERHNKKAVQKIDIDAFEKGEICFMGYAPNPECVQQMKDKSITLIDSDTGKRREIKVGICPMRDETDLNLGYSIYTVGAPQLIVVSQSVLSELSDNICINSILAECDPDKEPEVTKQIKEITSNNICIPSIAHVEIKSKALADFNSSMVSFNVLSIGISVILILIGIINFINVMLTGVFTRRHELAVMESIGMTKIQIRKMLMLEGVYYGTITAALILSVGGISIYYILSNIKSVADYAEPYFPYKLMIAFIAVIILICMIVPAAAYKTISRKTVTERLRMED